VKPFRIGAGSRPDSHGPEKDAEALDFHDLSSPPDPAATIRIEHAGDHLDVIADPEGTPVKIGEIPGGGGGGSDVIPIIFGVGESPTGISPGVKRVVQLPADYVLSAWSLSADAVGDIEIDLWASATFPPTIGDSIVASNPPELVSQQSATGNVAGWVTTLPAGTWLAFFVPGATTPSGITRFDLTLTAIRSNP
jgi:hypothetical protein